MTTDLLRWPKTYVKKSPALHRLALKAYSIAHPPPYRLPNMEFHFDAWNAVSSLHYVGGRQIGEDNAGPYPYKESVKTQYETCRFRDSRLGLVMNVSNLRAVMPYATDAFRLITVLRNKYISQRGIEGSQLDLINAYAFSKFAVSLPAYVTRRRDKPVPDGHLPPLETAFYMLGTAPFMLVRQMMVRGDATPLERGPLNGERLYELCDRSGVLISTRKQACPAAPKLIADFMDVIMNGTYTMPLESVEVDRVLKVLGDWDRFYGYALATSRLELLIKLAQALTARELDRLHAYQHAQSGQPDPMLVEALREAVARSYVHTSEDRDEPAVLQTIIDVLTELFADHGELSVIEELDRQDLLSAPRDTTDSVSKAATRIRKLISVVAPACQRNLATVQASLGWSDWPGIDERALVDRIAGPRLAGLITA